MLDLAPFRNGEKTFAQLAEPLTKADLYTLFNELIDAQAAELADVTDADLTFVYDDAELKEGEIAWTLNHVIAHTTASGEESFANGLTLARGVEITGRSRYESPWETITTADQMRQRLEESRRMRLAMLDAWPDEPHYDNTFTPFPRAGAINAKGCVVMCLNHDTIHLGQLREIKRQLRASHQ